MCKWTTAAFRASCCDALRSQSAVMSQRRASLLPDQVAWAGKAILKASRSRDLSMRSMRTTCTAPRSVRPVTRGPFSQSHPEPGALNTITVSLQASVLLPSSSSIIISGLSGATKFQGTDSVAGVMPLLVNAAPFESGICKMHCRPDMLRFLRGPMVDARSCFAPFLCSPREGRSGSKPRTRPGMRTGTY